MPKNSRWITYIGLMLLPLFVYAKKPNVVFIVVDDLGWKDTGCYGSSFYETPNVDRLAESGMRFTDAYSANPLCSPTRASILTGQYPARIGFTSASGHVKGDHKNEETRKASPDARAAGPKSVNHLPLDAFTLGKAMKEGGYATAFLGKWHMGFDPHIPENHGFDLVIGGREHPGPPGTNPARKFYPPWSGDTLQPNPKKDIHIDDYLGQQAVEYINEHRGESFFMCLWLYNVHAPFQSKPALIKKWKAKADPNNPQHSPTMAAMIEVMDDNVGRVLDALRANGIDDETIVVFTSDNGGNMYDVSDDTTPTNNAPLRSGKGNNYEGGTRIPLIVSWPGKIKGGTVSNSVVSTVDHYPTFLQLTRQWLRPDDHKDGVSYLPALRGESHDRGPTICDFTHFVPATMNIPNSSIRDGDWKLYRFWFDSQEQTHRYELYNLADDIGESNNLADQSPEKVKALAAKLDAIRSDIGALNVYPNENYNGRTVGVWAAQGKGDVGSRDGSLLMKASQSGFGATTRVAPSLVHGAFLEFEGRSTNDSEVSVQWTSSAQKKFGEPQVETKTLGNDWQAHKVSLDFKGRISQVRFLLGESGAQAELRNVRLLTLDGSVITEYAFY